MEDISANKVVNTHHFGGVDKLPPDTRYIGRPSAYGNPYSSKSGKYTREDCIALHRIGLYRTLTNDPTYFENLKKDLCGYDLACWCKQPNKIVGCHGDTYLHIFASPSDKRRYDKSILHYLMEDLRYVLSVLEKRIDTDVADEDFLMLYFSFGDTKLNIQSILTRCREDFVPDNDIQLLVAKLIVDLELAAMDPNLAQVDFRLQHASWIIDVFSNPNIYSGYEPTRPDISLEKPTRPESIITDDASASTNEKLRNAIPIS